MDKTGWVGGNWVVGRVGGSVMCVCEEGEVLLLQFKRVIFCFLLKSVGSLSPFGMWSLICYFIVMVQSLFLCVAERFELHLPLLRFWLPKARRVTMSN